MDETDVYRILARYAAGYFPMMDFPDAAGRSEFFWDRWPVRAVLPVNAQTLARARRMQRRAMAAAEGETGGEGGGGAGGGRLEIRYSTAVEEVIAQLQTVKENSWVRQEVVDIYRALRGAGVLQTVEAWTTAGTPRLVGALLGIVLPGTFVAETMYGLVPEASKICLCQLIQDCAADGFAMIDVQTPHDVDENGDPLPRTGTAHPCIRLGEVRMPVAEFLAAFRAAWSRAFPGDIAAWLALAKSGTPDGTSLAPADPRRFLRHASVAAK